MDGSQFDLVVKQAVSRTSRRTLAGGLLAAAAGVILGKSVTASSMPMGWIDENGDVTTNGDGVGDICLDCKGDCYKKTDFYRARYNFCMDSGIGEGKGMKPCEYCREWTGCSPISVLKLPAC